MRVAMGLALNEIDREARAIEFYEVLSSFDFMSSTPTLFNSGSLRSQLSSCYLTTVPDDLDGIYESIKENALLSKFAGGLGNDWSRVRALGSHIKGTNGESQGVVPFLKVVNDTAVAVNQGGKRKGAVCTYLETWHLFYSEYKIYLDIKISDVFKKNFSIQQSTKQTNLKCPLTFLENEHPNFSITKNLNNKKMK
jgi:ribonucleoside-diphosphate reductase alpha chain